MLSIIGHDSTKVLENEGYLHFISLESIGIWVHNALCKSAILGENQQKGAKNGQNGRLAEGIVSPNPNGFQSNKM